MAYNQITEVIRHVTESNQNYIIKGKWVCHNWRCKHELQCHDEIVCKNKCQHEPQCLTETECRTKWLCKHEPTCTTRVKCQGSWICRHKPVCQSKSHCKKNWRCRHQPQCEDIWECKYRWTEEHEPHCQGRWECHHGTKCQTKLECQNKQFQFECLHEPRCYSERECQKRWECPHEPRCNNRWGCQNIWGCLHKPRCYNKWKCQNKWQCQHEEKCNRPALCKAKCQHQCENEIECLKKSPQPTKNNYDVDGWKCQHQCRDIRECREKWNCPHNPYKCKTELDCRYRLWRCVHSPPCRKSEECHARWEKENEWNCIHETECLSSWQCLNDPLYRNNWQCQKEWVSEYSRDLLKAILNNRRSSFFVRREICDECVEGDAFDYINCSMMSFLLYKGSQLVNEIICHLVWVKAKETKGQVFYRVFGKWKCNNFNCRNNYWYSSYTWISLQKYIEKCQRNLQTRDFSNMKCRNCRNNGTIVSWKPIEESKNTPQHEGELCEKCRSGEFCTQSSLYLAHIRA